MSTQKQNTFYLRIIGDGMRPRIRDGEHVIVDPDYRFTQGDDVVVFLKDGRRIVERFIAENDGKYEFGSINDDYEITIRPKSEIEKVHSIAARVMKGADLPDVATKVQGVKLRLLRREENRKPYPAGAVFHLGDNVRDVMSKLLKLKEWVSIPDAAKYISEKLQESVSDKDVIQLALDERLPISIKFIDSAEVNVILRMDGKTEIYDDAQINGIFDLCMSKEYRLYLEHKCHGVQRKNAAIYQAKIKDSDTRGHHVTFLIRTAESPSETDVVISGQSYSKVNSRRMVIPPEEFSFSLVVRTDALDDFLNEIGDSEGDSGESSSYLSSLQNDDAINWKYVAYKKAKELGYPDAERKQTDLAGEIKEHLDANGIKNDRGKKPVSISLIIRDVLRMSAWEELEKQFGDHEPRK